MQQSALVAGERGASGGGGPAAEEERQALNVSRMRNGTLGGLGWGFATLAIP